MATIRSMMKSSQVFTKTSEIYYGLIISICYGVLSATPDSYRMSNSMP